MTRAFIVQLNLDDGDLTDLELVEEDIHELLEAHFEVIAVNVWQSPDATVSSTPVPPQ